MGEHLLNNSLCLIPQTEPEIIEETNVDRVHEPRGYSRARQVKGHSETSTLSSQPSIDEVRQQMHMLLEEAFSLASAGHAGQSRHQEAYGSTQHLPYSEVVTSAPGTMTRPRAGVQWVPTYRPEMYQYSLPRPVSRNSSSPTIFGFALPHWIPAGGPEQGFGNLETSCAGVFSYTSLMIHSQTLFLRDRFITFPFLLSPLKGLIHSPLTGGFLHSQT